MSAEGWNPRPTLEVANISDRLRAHRDAVMPMLTELSDMKLIRFNEYGKTTLRLTLLGNNVNRTKD